MAYYLADKLNIRPAEILDDWSVPELIVTYGEFANRESNKAYNQYNQLDPKARAKVKPKPQEYHVLFRRREDL